MPGTGLARNGEIGATPRANVAFSRSLRSWLLDDADPSVRLRVLRDLLDRPPDDPERRSAQAAIGRTGWARRILDEQLGGGTWVSTRTDRRSLYRPKYIATTWKLIVLAELGLSGRHPRVQRALSRYLRTFGSGSSAGIGFPAGEVCLTGNLARTLVLFGRGDERPTRAAFDWLVRHQKRDGGWNCFPRSTGTLDGWEALAAFSVVPPPKRSAAVDRAVARGAEFYLDRGLLREGRGSYAPWRRLHYPNHYYYDVLVGLSMLVRLGYAEDRRLRPALELLESKRRTDGRWGLDAYHPDSEDPEYQVRPPVYPFVLETVGPPSRWITVTALEVLRACGRG